jgi:1-acyl-sn-glycerol-3-phosphate acyltransferase
MADALVFATTIGRSGRIPTFLGMAEMFRWPVIGPVLSRMGHVPVHRGSTSAADALQPALDVLVGGGVVGLYPEGRVTTEPDYRPMPTGKSGAVRLALAAGCPIVPVAQWGAHHLLTREHESALTRKVRVFGWLRPGRSSVAHASTSSSALPSATPSCSPPPRSPAARSPTTGRRPRW